MTCRLVGNGAMRESFTEEVAIQLSLKRWVEV